jgi:hypothetical protein
MQKLKILTTILLLSLTSFSQTDTSKICFDYKIAQRIASDLVNGDKAIAELEETNNLVFQLKETIIQKDSVINVYIQKDSICQLQNQLNFDIQQKQKNIIFGLEKDVESLKRENQNLRTGIKWIGGGFVGVLTSFIIFIMIK